MSVGPGEPVESTLTDVEDAYWSARVEQVLGQAEPTVPWPEALARLDAGDLDPGW